MSYSICVDASLALDWLLPAQKSEAIDRLWQQWKDARIRLVTPPLFHAEVTSTIREHVFFKRILPEEGELIFLEYLSTQSTTIYTTDITKIAWELAQKYNLPRTYDMQYLAVAELEDCELWTTDRKLVNTVRQNKRIKWVGEFSKKKV